MEACTAPLVASTLVEPRPVRRPREALEVADGDGGILEVRDLAYADALLVEKCPAAALGPGELVVGRRIGYAEHQLAGAHQGDLRGEERHLAHEVFGAIDRIDQPDVLGPHRVLPGLLTIETVTGKRARQSRTDHFLGAHVSFGNR